jgi:cysteine desulfurase/selenocysteine lyase
MDAPSVRNKKFFSYATVAPMGEPAYTAVKTFIDDFYNIGPPDALYMYDPMADKLAEQAAKLINCDASEVTYIKNTTEGINIACDTLPLEPGDEVLVQACEYPANLLPWLKKRNDGLTVTVIDGETTESSFEKLISSITASTKAIAISSAQYYDGYMADIAGLSKICHEQGIFLVLDAVQTAGIRKIDVQEIPVDFLVAGGQKYLRAGVGCGFMYVNKNILSKLRDTRVGIRSMEHFDASSYTLKPSAARFQDGTQNLFGIVALHAALTYVNEQGVETIEHKNLGLLASIKNVLHEQNIPFIDHGNDQGNIVSMQIADPTGLTEYLKQHGVYIKTIKDVARLSFVHDSKFEDIQTLAEFTRSWLDITR